VAPPIFPSNSKIGFLRFTVVALTPLTQLSGLTLASRTGLDFPFSRTSRFGHLCPCNSAPCDGPGVFLVVGSTLAEACPEGIWHRGNSDVAQNHGCRHEPLSPNSSGRWLPPRTTPFSRLRIARLPLSGRGAALRCGLCGHGTPQLDGLELARRIRKSPLNLETTIVMLSATDDVKSLRTAFGEGADSSCPSP